MKLKLLTIFSLFFVVFAAKGQSENNSGFVCFYSVNSDKMISKTNFAADKNYYWVETDESFGEINLEFESIKHPLTPKSAYLLINIPQVTDGQSNTGVVVYANDKIVGKADTGNTGTHIKIALDINITGYLSNNVSLTLKGGGIDGLAVYSKASGFGAVLEFVY